MTVSPKARGAEGVDQAPAARGLPPGLRAGLVGLGAGTSLLLEGFALGGEGAQVVACHEGVALVREVRARPASSCESQPLSQVGISECSNRKAWYKSERISVA